MSARRHLRLVTSVTGAVPDEVEPAAPVTTTSDSAALESRVMIQRLADQLVALQTTDVPIPEQDVVVAVFRRDALPDLSGLLFQGRGGPKR